MRATTDRHRRAPRTRPPGNARLLERLAEALDSGRVSPDEVERLLSRGGRPLVGGSIAATVLYALGTTVVFCGLAIAYGTIFEDLSRPARMITPYAFPLVALGGCVWLSRRGFARWQIDVAGLVGFVAFGVAFGVSAAASGWVQTGDENAAAVALAALVGVVVVAAIHRATRSARLLWAGMPAALASFGVAAAYLARLWETETEGPERLGWVILAEAGVAAGVAAVLARRGRTGDCLYATLWATLGGYAAVMLSGEDLADFSVWHLVLAGVVIAAFLTAAAMDFDALIWVAAAGGAWWAVMIAVVVGSATGAALAVVLAGMGLVGLGLLVARMRRGAGGPARLPG